MFYRNQNKIAFWGWKPSNRKKNKIRTFCGWKPSNRKKNKIRTFGGWKPSKNKNIEPHQSFTGSYWLKALLVEIKVPRVVV